MGNSKVKRGRHTLCDLLCMMIQYTRKHIMHRNHKSPDVNSEFKAALCISISQRSEEEQQGGMLCCEAGWHSTARNVLGSNLPGTLLGEIFTFYDR
jgi:hypothetical protein